MSTLSFRKQLPVLSAPAVAAMAALSHAAAADSNKWCAERCDQIVIDWNLQTHQVIKEADAYADPMAASRILAMVHLAMHDAVNAAEPIYRSYAYTPESRAGSPLPMLLLPPRWRRTTFWPRSTRSRRNSCGWRSIRRCSMPAPALHAVAAESVRQRHGRCRAQRARRA